MFDLLLVESNDYDSKYFLSYITDTIQLSIEFRDYEVSTDYDTYISIFDLKDQGTNIRITLLSDKIKVEFSNNGFTQFIFPHSFEADKQSFIQVLDSLRALNTGFNLSRHV